MSPHEFNLIVAAMRATQKKFFKTRNEQDLKNARKMETKVDAELELRINQGHLFGEIDA